MTRFPSIPITWGESDRKTEEDEDEEDGDESDHGKCSEDL
jgi:hypothetical protein